MSTINASDEINAQAANDLIRRCLEHVKAGGLSFREAAAYEIGRTKGIGLDRLDKVEALTRDAFLKAAGTERIIVGGATHNAPPPEAPLIESGCFVADDQYEQKPVWRSCTDDQELAPDDTDYGLQERLCESAVAEAPEDVRNLETLEHLIEQEKPCLFFYRHPVRPSEKLRPTDPDEAAGWRHVSPYEVRESVKSGLEYVVGWDHDLEAIRNFTVQRIEGLVVVDNQNEYRPTISEIGEA